MLVSDSAKRCLTPLWNRPFWTLVRLGLWLFGATVVFGLLMLASVWFAIPFAFALVTLGVVSLETALRARVGWQLVRRWRLR
jgi:hypothetical protein